MNPLILAAFSLLILSSASRAAQMPATEVAPRMDVELSIAQLRQLLLVNPECKSDPEDEARLAAGLKDKFGLVMCREKGKMEATVLISQTGQRFQRLAFSAAEDNILVGGRLIDHYFVIEFDTYQRYFDLQKRTETGFALSGAVEGRRIGQFEDPRIFMDALKNYSGIKDPAALAVISSEIERVAKIEDIKKYFLEAHSAGGKWVVILKSDPLKPDSRTYQIWPTKGDIR